MKPPVSPLAERFWSKVEPRPIVPHSMVRAMAAYEAATAELGLRNLGQVVYILRDLSPDERDLVEAMLEADPEPPDPGAISVEVHRP